ncbi:hypothetical protein M1439_01285 [Candidatus Marsarchaeota archaeon]|jgi:hypothetical protein|nr:hypothetical protein [Candidatus Marsarchaeota archaeon]
MPETEKTKTYKDEYDAKIVELVEKMIRSDYKEEINYYKNEDDKKVKINLEIAEFKEGSNGRLLRVDGFPGGVKTVDIIEFNETGIKFWRQKEECFSGYNVTSEYGISWEQIEALSKAEKIKENNNMGPFTITSENAKRLIELRYAKKHTVTTYKQLNIKK